VASLPPRLFPHIIAYAAKAAFGLFLTRLSWRSTEITLSLLQSNLRFRASLAFVSTLALVKAARVGTQLLDTPRLSGTRILGSPRPLKLDSLQSLDQRWDSPQALIRVCPTLFAFEQVLFQFEANSLQML
jgi:hypothetical protein